MWWRNAGDAELVGLIVADVGADKDPHIDADADQRSPRSSSRNAMSSSAGGSIQQGDSPGVPREGLEKGPQWGDADAAGDERDPGRVRRMAVKVP